MDILDVVEDFFAHAPVPPGEVAVDNQAEVGGLWLAIRRGDLDELRRLVEDEGHSLACRGPVGETAFHYSFLLQNDLAIKNYIISKQPELLRLQYDQGMVNFYSDEVERLEREEPKSRKLRGMAPAGFGYAHITRTMALKPLSHYAARVVTPGCNGPYDGESALHIAIVNDDLEGAEWLIRMAPDLLHARAFGGFFALELFEKLEGQSSYFGELALSFAVATNNRKMVTMLLDAGAPYSGKEAADCHGNGPFHIAVYHQHVSMHEFLVEKIKQRLLDDGLTPESASGRLHTILSAPNKAGFTPLVLAAHLGLAATFNALLDARSMKEWSFGAVTCSLFPLAELDGTKVCPDVGTYECRFESGDKPSQDTTAYRCCIRYSRWRGCLQTTLFCCPAAVDARGLKLSTMFTHGMYTLGMCLSCLCRLAVRQCGPAGSARTMTKNMLGLWRRDSEAGRARIGGGTHAGDLDRVESDESVVGASALSRHGSSVDPGTSGEHATPQQLRRAASDAAGRAVMFGDVDESPSDEPSVLIRRHSQGSDGSLSSGGATAAFGERLAQLAVPAVEDTSAAGKSRIQFERSSSSGDGDDDNDDQYDDDSQIPVVRTALDVITEEDRVEILNLKRMQTLLDRKWKAVAARVVTARFRHFIFHLGLFTMLTWWRSFTGRIDQPWLTHSIAEAVDHWSHVSDSLERLNFALQTSLLVVAEAGVIAVAGYKLLIELAELAEEGPTDYFWCTGASMLENWAAFTHTGLLFASVMSLTVNWVAETTGFGQALKDAAAGPSPAFPATASISALLLYLQSTASIFTLQAIVRMAQWIWMSRVIMVALSSLACWMYSLWFLLGTQSAGPLVVMVFRMLQNDVYTFSSFAMIIVVGFTHSYSLISQDGYLLEPISIFIRAMAGDMPAETSVSNATNVEEKNLTDSFASLLVLVYVLLVTILLLNILVAMLNDSYNSIKEQSKLRWLLERARIISSVEKESGFYHGHPGLTKYWVRSQTHGAGGEMRYEAYIRIEEADMSKYSDTRNDEAGCVNEAKLVDEAKAALVAATERIGQLIQPSSQGQDLKHHLSDDDEEEEEEEEEDDERVTMMTPARKRSTARRASTRPTTRASTRRASSGRRARR